MTRSRFLAGAFLAVALTAAAPTPAHSATAVRISYHDLDLATGTGRELLDQRLRNAARAVCGTTGAHGLAATAACHRTTLAQGRAIATRRAVTLAMR